MNYGAKPWQQTQWDWRAAGNFMGAVTALNNLGAMLLFGGQPADAVAPTGRPGSRPPRSTSP